MKYMKYVVLLVCAVFLFGCTLANSPTSKVEDLFTRYQTLDDIVTTQIQEVVTEGDLTEEQQRRYTNILEKQYQNLTYEVKNEKMDGDTSVVTVQIEVLDFKKALNTVVNDNSTLIEFNNLRLDALENAKDKVKYTLELIVNKDKDNNWTLAALSNVDIKKIQGMY